MTAYAPHQDFIAPARRSSALFHTLVGFCAVEFFYALGRDAIDYFTFNIAPARLAEFLDRESAAAILYDLLSFAMLIVVLAVVVRLTHQRSVRSLFGPMSQVRRDILRGTVGGVVLFLALEFVLPWWDQDAATMRPMGGWLLYLPWALVALFVQTTAEEMFYRGYLQQQIAARFASPLVWLTLPNIAFASVHWFNGEAFGDSVQYIVWAFVFGLAASDLTARTGSLGAAIGFHLANNIFAFLVVGEADMMDSGLALFLLPPMPAGAEEPLAEAEPILTLAFGTDLLIILLAWLAVRVAIRR